MQNISEETVRSVIGRYGDMVMRIAYQNTRDRAESEDIVQEVFLALFLRPLPKSEEHLKAWLIRVTINKSRNVIKAARRKVLPLDERIVPPSAWERPSEAEVLEALFALPFDERNALYLFYYEGYSAKEIGKLLRRSENAIYILLSRARKRLRSIWEERMKLEEYKKALSAAALGEEEEERLAAAVVKKLEKRRKKKRIVRRVLVPVLSAAVLCIAAVPLAFARAPAGAPAGSEPDHSDPPFSEEDPPSEEDPSETTEEPEAFSCVYEAGGVRLCFDIDLNEIR